MVNQQEHGALGAENQALNPVHGVASDTVGHGSETRCGNYQRHFGADEDHDNFSFSQLQVISHLFRDLGPNREVHEEREGSYQENDYLSGVIKRKRQLILNVVDGVCLVREKCVWILIRQ
eukprot:CAMPEP_0116951816 /NCGR_PEP_ID=MMETSP0467-20121206/40354_1 /TAXON_ID=283647 /ORGANISM="Mesodinium pulex, Strain SPMC105" /LENGTH=119 /DNA_ID=CAMNT_0004636953 /DNA_START=353 /DNA_END=712 /DNA_ORIENTATION=-